jgi:glycosyltransferase 2 family protein
MSNAVTERHHKVSLGRTVSILAALLLAFVLLYFSLRGIDWRGAWDLIRGAQLRYLLIGIFLSSGGLLLRALRWRVLLSAESTVGIPVAFWATSAGYFGNNFLPARAGELVRTLIISSSSGLSGAFVLATALSERVADAVVLVAISAAVVLRLPDPPGWLSGVALPSAILALCGTVGIALAPRFERLGYGVLARFRLSPRLRSKTHDALAHAIRGIRVLHSPRRLIAFLGLTAIVWFLDATVTIACASALRLHFTYSVAFLLVAGLGLSSALPSTPGYVGIYQFVAVSVLVPFGFSGTEAIAYILLAQVISYLVIGFWGSLGFWMHPPVSLAKDPSRMRSGVSGE